MLSIGADFPAAKLRDTNGEIVEFPTAFAEAPATVVFFYRGRW
jgi:peroxiredoxin